MTKERARKILDEVKEGKFHTQFAIKLALAVLGEL